MSCYQTDDGIRIVDKRIAQRPCRDKEKKDRDKKRIWKSVRHEHYTKKHTSNTDRQQEKKGTNEKDELSMKTDKESFIIRIKKLKEDIRGKEITNTKKVGKSKKVYTVYELFRSKRGLLTMC